MPLDNEIFGDIQSGKKSDTDIFKDTGTAIGSTAPPKQMAATEPAYVPSNARVALNASSKAIAAVPDALLNTPTNILNLIKAGYGTVATASGRPDLAPEVSNPHNYFNNLFRRIGAIGQGGEPVTQGQRILDTAVQAGVGSAINPSASVGQLAANIGVGAASGLAGGVTREATGSPTAGMAASILTPGAINAVGNYARNRIQTLQEQQSANAVRDKVLLDAREKGLVVSPSSINPNPINRTIESIGGKADTKQAATLKNEQTFNKMAVDEIGLPKGTAITEGVLEKFRFDKSEPYREIANISPLAKSALENLKQSRSDSKLEWNHYNRSGDPSAYKRATALDQKADMLEKAIDRIAVRTGKPDLINDLRDARQAIAKSYDIERALNVGNASISAPHIGAALDRGAPLSGNLKLIGQFQQGPGRQFSNEGAATGSPGVSALAPYSMALAAAMGRPEALAAAGLPLVRGPARALMLSPMYQRLMATPNYDPSMATRLASNLPQSNALASMLAVTPQAQSRLMDLLNQGQQ